MAYGESIYVHVRAIDVTTGLPVTGDAANIDLYLSKDGGPLAACTNAVAEDGYGHYKVQLSAAENSCTTGLVTGESSTGNVVIIGAQWHNPATAALIADAVLDEDPSDHDSAGTLGEAILDMLAGTGVNGEVDNETANTRVLLDTDGLTTRATLTHVVDGDEVTITRS